jgi:hypothetical protein
MMQADPNRNGRGASATDGLRSPNGNMAHGDFSGDLARGIGLIGVLAFGIAFWAIVAWALVKIF